MKEGLQDEFNSLPSFCQQSCLTDYIVNLSAFFSLWKQYPLPQTYALFNIPCFVQNYVKCVDTPGELTLLDSVYLQIPM